MTSQSTVARYLVAGRPLPCIEDAVKIGEVVRAAALSTFGFNTDDETGGEFPAHRGRSLAATR